MSKNSLIPLILQQELPKYERLIEQIAADYELDAKNMKKKYLGDLKEYKKKTSKRKGVINPYAAFLGDKSVENKLRKSNPEATFGELSKLKGPIWKKMSDKDKQKYVKLAKEMTMENQKNKESEDSDDEADTVEI